MSFVSKDWVLQQRWPPRAPSHPIYLGNPLPSTHSCPKHTLWQHEKAFIYMEKQHWDSAGMLSLVWKASGFCPLKKKVVFFFFSFSFLFYFLSYVFLPVLLPTALAGGFHQEVQLCITHRLSGWLCSTSRVRGTVKEERAQWNSTQDVFIQPSPNSHVSIAKIWQLQLWGTALRVSNSLSIFPTQHFSDFLVTVWSLYCFAVCSSKVQKGYFTSDLRVNGRQKEVGVK